LLTTIDTSAAAFAAAATDSSSATSTRSGTIRSWRWGCGVRDVAYTFAAPRSSSSSTIARPKPRLPPVTTAAAPSMRVACGEFMLDVVAPFMGLEWWIWRQHVAG
jgi:hypothetical protein